MHRVLQLVLRVLHQFLHLFQHVTHRLPVCCICLHVCNDVHVCFGYFGHNPVDDGQAEAESEQKHVGSATDAVQCVCDVMWGAPAARGGAIRCASTQTASSSSIAHLRLFITAHRHHWLCANCICEYVVHITWVVHACKSVLFQRVNIITINPRWLFY